MATAPLSDPAPGVGDDVSLRRAARAMFGLRHWCEAYSSYEAPWCRFHIDFMAALDSEAERIAIMGPRDFGKTSIGSGDFPLREAIANPDVHLIVFAQTDLDLAALDLESLAKRIETSDSRGGPLRDDWGTLRGPTWKRYAIDIRKAGCPGMEREYCRVMCVSPQKSIMGAKLGDHRPELVIMMDPQRVRRTSMADPRQVRSFEDWIEGDIMGSIPDGGRLVLCANPLDRRSYICKLCEGVGLTGPDGAEYGRSDKAAAAKHSRWVRRRYQTEIIGHPRIPDGTPLWPEWWSLDRIARRKLECKSHVWAAHHQCDPLDPGGAVFPADILSREQGYGPRPMTGAEARRRWPGIRIAGAIDPAFSRSSSADRTAIGIVGRTADGWMPVLLGRRYDNRGMAARADLVFELHSTWGFDRFGVEVVQAQVDFFEYLEQQQRERGQYFPLDKVVPRSDVAKLARIEDMEPAIRNGHLRLATDDEELRQLLADFRPDSAHDDVPDALQMAWCIARWKRGAGASMDVPPPRADGKRDWYRESPRKW